MIDRLKKFFRKLWLKIKKLWMAFLIFLGIIAAPILFAGTLNLAWTNATQRIDGTPFDAATEQAAIRIYCNDVPTPMFVTAGDITSLTEIVPAGDYTCYATTVDNDGLESFASNTVTKTVDKALPSPPVLTP